MTKMEEMIEVLDLAPVARVLDIGSGKSELLIRLVERYGAQATGVDRSSQFFQEAREQAARRLPAGKLELLEMDIHDLGEQASSFDLAICIGASEVFGGYRGTLRRLAEFVKSGGLVLVGDGYWKCEPDPTYLEALGESREVFMEHAGNVAVGVELGLVPMYVLVASDDDWDRYEWLHLRAIERYAREQPNDPDVPALLERIRGWRDLYLRWGRDTLGFGLYLFQK
jgi:ubiquinone/menaquinone biosynthesis C-methylase UbiE